MKKIPALLFACLVSTLLLAQDVMTPETLWNLGRVSPLGISKDKKNIVYKVSIPDVANDNFSGTYFSIPIEGGVPLTISAEEANRLVKNDNVSPDGKRILTHANVAISAMKGTDRYEDLDKSNAYVYDDLNYRHWDTWEDGKYSHVFHHSYTNGRIGEGTDIMEGQAFDCPQQPFGGSEDYIWGPYSRKVIYVTKPLVGKEYATSTNTDLFQYDIYTKRTKNLTKDNPGYDFSPAYSSRNVLAWISMSRDGYESDKADIKVRANNVTRNLTQYWDESVRAFIWSNDGKTIYFTGATDGTVQLFSVDFPSFSKKMPVVKQITKGNFDIRGLIGQVDNKLYVTSGDMNQASEIYSIDLKTGERAQLTQTNDAVYNNIGLSKTERRYFKTKDGKDLMSWVIFPPNFDPGKKYPTLLYCQGGPQSALSQFYSFRWNFQLMAAQGYIVVAPNRRGMPGHGVAWNEAISKDHGGLAMDDYLLAIDEMAKEPYVDSDRLGCVGASYGGYSVFYLAGIHQNRFKSFIAHDGIFNLKSMYGTTEELFFLNWDYGGSYFDTENAAAMNTYKNFDPSNLVNNWNTPIYIIQGGKDYRVPIGQGLEAFQAAQLKGLKSRLLYLPEENHWVLRPQNGVLWQREFFKWLEETL